MSSATTGAWKTAPTCLSCPGPTSSAKSIAAISRPAPTWWRPTPSARSPITLGEFDISDEAFEINKQAAELAREAAESFKDGRQRFVLGSVGPGTRLPSLGHVAYQPLEDALTVQARGLIAGGVDAILIETCQDPLQIKAAVNGVKVARARGRHRHSRSSSR